MYNVLVIRGERVVGGEESSWGRGCISPLYKASSVLLHNFERSLDEIEATVDSTSTPSVIKRSASTRGSYDYVYWRSHEVLD